MTPSFRFHVGYVLVNVQFRQDIHSVLQVFAIKAELLGQMLVVPDSDIVNVPHHDWHVAFVTVAIDCGSWLGCAHTCCRLVSCPDFLVARRACCICKLALGVCNARCRQESPGCALGYTVDHAHVCTPIASSELSSR